MFSEPSVILHLQPLASMWAEDLYKPSQVFPNWSRGSGIERSPWYPQRDGPGVPPQQREPPNPSVPISSRRGCICTYNTIYLLA